MYLYLNWIGGQVADAYCVMQLTVSVNEKLKKDLVEVATCVNID